MNIRTDERDSRAFAMDFPPGTRVLTVRTRSKRTEIEFLSAPDRPTDPGLGACPATRWSTEARVLEAILTICGNVYTARKSADLLDDDRPPLRRAREAAVDC